VNITEVATATAEHIGSDDTIKNQPCPYEPKKMKELNAELERKFGRGYAGRPLFRVIWPNSPEGLMFACDAWYMKYLGARQHYRETEGYLVIDKNNTTKRYYVKAAKARGLLNAKDDDKILIPKIKEETVEIAVPRFVIERLAAPHELVGLDVDESRLKEEWDANRWLEITDPLHPEYDPSGGINRDGSLKNIHPIDVLGAFPAEGQYVAFIYIENQIKNKDGEVIGTSYKEFTESDFNVIAEEWKKFQEWHKKSSEEKQKIKQEKSDTQMSEMINDSIDEVSEEISHRLLHKTTVGWTPEEGLRARALSLIQHSFGTVEKISTENSNEHSNNSTSN
jgi:hypothetical protein